MAITKRLDGFELILRPGQPEVDENGDPVVYPDNPTNMEAAAVIQVVAVDDTDGEGVIKTRHVTTKDAQKIRRWLNRVIGTSGDIPGIDAIKDPS